MRALVAASLLPSGSGAVARDLSALASQQPPDAQLLLDVRRRIAGAYDERPRVLDMFGGGGTIPFEALTLGVETHVVEVSELAAFLNKTLLELAPQITNLGDRISESGARVLSNLAEVTARMFPARPTASNYIWTYATKCSACGFSYSLCKRPWLSRKKGRRIATRVHTTDTDQRTEIDHNASDLSSQSAWRSRSGHVRCPKCDFECRPNASRGCSDRHVATIELSNPGKVFRKPTSYDLPSPEICAEIEELALRQLGAELPATELPQWSGIVNPAMYGIERHAQVFNPRQRSTLLALIAALRREHDRLRATDGPETALAVTALLSGLVDQVVDWNCRLSMWIPQNEQVGRAFCGPGIAMLWDYAETDPVGRGPSNLWAKLKRIENGARLLEGLECAASVVNASAQNLPHRDEFFDAIVTDPPYYDNLFYSVLADFFYVWKRLLFRDLLPELFAPPSTSTRDELVASRQRSGSTRAAFDDYVQNLTVALSEASRVLKQEGVFCMLYGHSALDGWRALVHSYRATSLHVTSVQPLSIERRQRPRAMTSDAVNTCVVLVARKRTNSAKRPIRLKTLVDRVEQCTANYMASLRPAGWADADIAMAAFAQASGILSNASQVEGHTDTEALLKVADYLQTQFSEFRLQRRGSI